jgi:hypothetical protein
MKERIMEWQPIETAPVDGTPVLLAAAGTVFEGEYKPDANGWWLANTDPTDYHDGQVWPTHWMPLPHPPKEP